MLKRKYFQSMHSVRSLASSSSLTEVRKWPRPSKISSFRNSCAAALANSFARYFEPALLFLFRCFPASFAFFAKPYWLLAARKTTSRKTPISVACLTTRSIVSGRAIAMPSVMARGDSRSGRSSLPIRETLTLPRRIPVIRHSQTEP